MRRVPVFLLLLAVLAGCGEGAKTVTVTTTVPATTGPSEEKTSLRVYFLENGRVQPVSRQVAKTQAVAGAALAELLKGPTPDERRLGLSPALETFSAWRLVGTEGALRLTHAPELNAPAVAQIVFTLTQFPTVKAVDIDRKRYTRG